MAKRFAITAITRSPRRRGCRSPTRLASSGAGGTANTIEADDYLISPPLNVASPVTFVDFEYYENFGDVIDDPLTVLVTDAYTGDPATKFS